MTKHTRANGIAVQFGGVDELVFWSFRYFIGRRTIHTCVFAGQLAASWPLLGERVRQGIAEELEREFKRDDGARSRGALVFPLGMDCDREHWEKVRACYRKPA